jgi:hypothetical protein
VVSDFPAAVCLSKTSDFSAAAWAASLAIQICLVAPLDDLARGCPDPGQSGAGRDDVNEAAGDQRSAAGGTKKESDAGAPEITPKMLASGIYMIAEEYGVCGVDIAPDLARDVFKATWAQKDQEPNSSSSWRSSAKPLLARARTTTRQSVGSQSSGNDNIQSCP